MTQSSAAFGSPDLLVVVFVSILDLAEYTLDFMNTMDQTDILHSACFTGGVLTGGRRRGLAVCGRKVTGT